MTLFYRTALSVGKKRQYIQILTCFSLYLLAEDTGALRVLGSDCKRMQLAALQPRYHLEHLSCSVVYIGSTIVLGVDEVVNSSFWTLAPAHGDVIVAASCHRGHISRRADY